MPGYAAPTWSGVIGPAGIPRPIVEKLNAAINRAIASPAFKERFASIGDEPAGGTPEEFAETIRKDSAKWREVVQRSGQSWINASRWGYRFSTAWQCHNPLNQL